MKTVLALLALVSIPLFAQPTQPSLDYPLALKTRWTYHIRHENGPGVQFGDAFAAFVKGNVLEATIVSEAAGVDAIGGLSYTRLESRLNGKPWLFEWGRLTREGFMIGKSVNYEQGGEEVLMQPEQKRISAARRPGDFWYWQPTGAPVRIRFDVVGPGEVEVPAGRYTGTHLTTSLTLKAPVGTVVTHQDTWFVSGVGVVKQESINKLDERKLSQVLLTLEKFEKH